MQLVVEENLSYDDMMGDEVMVVYLAFPVCFCIVSERVPTMCMDNYQLVVNSVSFFSVQIARSVDVPMV